MESKTLSVIKERVKNLPRKPGVYIMRDVHGNIIYIGKAKVLKNRVSQYFLNTEKPEKVRLMVANVATFDYIITNTELEALNLESNLIKKHQPFYNILLKDGKAHPFLRIDTKQDFPKFEITRKVKKDGAKYFGPYFGSVNIRELLTLINSTFCLRTCSLNLNNGKRAKRECLNAHMGQCLAPCTGKISKEEYGKVVNKVINFLHGNLKEAKQIITEKMHSCADAQNFERAIAYRNNVNMINSLGEQMLTELKNNADIDVFGFFTNGTASVISILIVRAGKIMGLNNFNIIDINNTETDVLSAFIPQYYPSSSPVPAEVVLPCELGEVIGNYLAQESKTKVKVTVPIKGIRKNLVNMAVNNAKDYLEKNIEKNRLTELKTIGAMNLLKEHLHLPQTPVRIEGYDISNISGTNIVASMVVFVNGEPKYSHYRKFKIKTVDGSNDFACMKEVLTRRMLELKSDDISFKEPPNLIVIDGGKGQLSYAHSVLIEQGINFPIISLAKKEEEIFVPNSSIPIVLNKDDYGLKLLQRVRDESHRYAITFHRQLRQKNALVSELSRIPLIGKTKEIALLEYFMDINKIKNASVNELMQVKGISQKLAQNIYNYFHKSN